MAYCHSIVRQYTHAQIDSLIRLCEHCLRFIVKLLPRLDNAFVIFIIIYFLFLFRSHHFAAGHLYHTVCIATNISIITATISNAAAIHTRRSEGEGDRERKSEFNPKYDQNRTEMKKGRLFACWSRDKHEQHTNLNYQIFQFEDIQMIRERIGYAHLTIELRQCPPSNHGSTPLARVCVCVSVGWYWSSATFHRAFANFGIMCSWHTAVTVAAPQRGARVWNGQERVDHMWCVFSFILKIEYECCERLDSSIDSGNRCCWW